MNKITCLILFFSFQFFAINTVHSNPQNTSNEEQVVVYGVRPGPELWRIKNGENELWILGTLSLLPKRMDWHSELVEAIIEESQVLLLPPSADADIGFFKSLSLVTSLIGIKKNPDGKKLKDVVPKEMYEKWLVLKKKYMGNDRGVEKTRPIFASQELFDKAIKKIGLVYDKKVTKKVKKIAKRNKLELITPTVNLEFAQPKAAIKKFKKSDINDLNCFSTTLQRLELDIETMRLRANAWADGDVLKIKELEYPDQITACGYAFLNSDVVQDTEMKDIVPRLKKAWLDAAQEALDKNKSTFAILPMRDLIGQESFIQDLSALGYKIKIPK
ncbi:MAG: TraB/GumN family protein [Marinicellaceae bacterium]